MEGIDREIKPCPHMRNWVSALADGTLRGFARWFTRLHVKGCPHCSDAFRAFQRLRERLSAMAGRPAADKMPERRWETISAAWEEAEKKEAS